MAQVEITETAGCRKTLRIEVENDRIDSQVALTLKKMQKSVQLPGFRKGRVPGDMIMKRFGPMVREEAVRDMIPGVLAEVFKEQGISPVGEPQVLDLSYAEGVPVTLTVAVEEAPAIDVSGFEGLKVVKRIRSVAETDVEAQIDYIRRMRAEREEVDRPAREGDILVVNLQKLDQSGVPIIGEKMEGHVLTLDGHGTPSPEFDAQVVGMQKGEKKAVWFTYDESINRPELAGTSEAYEVEVLQVVENRIPELNDEFAEAVGGASSVEELREKTRENLRKHFENTTERQLHADLIAEFIRQYPFEVPESMVERVVQNELAGVKRAHPDEQYDEDEVRGRIRPDAVRAVQTYLITEAVRERQEIEVSREDVAARVEEIAASAGRSAQEVRREMIKEGQFDSLKHDMLQAKVFDWMTGVASIREEAVTDEPEQSSIVSPS